MKTKGRVTPAFCLMDGGIPMSNPLLSFDLLPHFDAIKPGHVIPALDEVLAWADTQIADLLDQERPSYASLLEPLALIEERVSRVWGPVSHLNAVMNSPELRAAYNAGLPKITAWSTGLRQNLHLYALVQQIDEGDEFPSLNRAQQRVIEHEMRSFRLSGITLPEDRRNEVARLQEELATLSANFSEHLLDATNGWELIVRDPQRLEGLPDSFKQAAHARAVGDGVCSSGELCWKLTLEAPSYLPVMTYAVDRELRRALYSGYVTRATEGALDNSPLIVEILNKRLELAARLGFENYAQLSLMRKMADSVEAVLAFLEELVDASRPAGQREFAELGAFAAENLGLDRLEAWDVAFAAEALKNERHAVDEEALRPYFPEPQVVQGVLAIVERLYGAKLIPIDAPVWHPDVQVFQVIGEGEEGVQLKKGILYLDLYARPHKRGGAWLFDAVTRARKGDEIQPPVAYLVCNFAPPQGGHPSLFTHQEVVTLFHEFGHALHHLLTKIDVLPVSGINGVEWDAVELPSQFFENWAWSHESLLLLSAHVETGDPLPEAAIRGLLAAKNHLSAMAMLRQLEFALMDMRLHAQSVPVDGEQVRATIEQTRREVAVVPTPDFNRFENGFNHIFGGGYSAGYYSYKWAEVLAADAFGRFEEEGLFDRTTGLEFLHHILEQGGAEHPMVLFERFRGGSRRWGLC